LGTQMGQRKFAHAEKPVGMTRPLHFDVVGEVESRFQVLAHHLVHDGTVVDAQNGDALALVLIEQEVAHLFQVADRNRLYPEQFLGEEKVRQRLLMQRIDLHQNDVLWILVANDGATQ